MRNFGDAIFNVAKNTAQSFEVASTAALEFARQGLGMEETLKRTNDALVLVRLSGLDAVSAVNPFASSEEDLANTVSPLKPIPSAPPIAPYLLV